MIYFLEVINYFEKISFIWNIYVIFPQQIKSITSFAKKRQQRLQALIPYVTLIPSVQDSNMKKDSL